jgi:putative serine protease PepD
VPGAARESRQPGPTWLVAGMMSLIAAVVGGGIGALAGRHDGYSSPGRVNVIGSSERNVSAPRSIARVAGTILPSVVSIEVKQGNGGDTGSGIILSRDGYILTNNHVVAALANGGTLTVTLNDKRTLPARIVGHPDIVSDLAVLKVSGVDNLTPASIGDSNTLQVGDPVIAVGSPLGLAGTVTSGIVSALNRPVVAGGEPGTPADVIDAIQTDAAINPGNSGGPLVDTAGKVVGVDSAIATLSGSSIGGDQSGSIGLGFAIPISQAGRIAQEIIAHGYSTHAVLGVRLDPAFKGNGARILSLTDSGSGGSPAQGAGLRAGDIITSVDGARITSAEDLVVAVRSRTPGERIRIGYRRGSEQQTTTVTLASARSDKT